MQMFQAVNRGTAWEGPAAALAGKKKRLGSQCPAFRSSVLVVY
jgi:hypothetical protein